MNYTSIKLLLKEQKEQLVAQMREDRLTLLPPASRRENMLYRALLWLWPDPQHARNMF